MNIVFMGSPDFAKESLKNLYEAGHNILAVITNPDKPKGRGMKLLPTPVKEYALEKKLKIFQPEKIKNNEEFIQEIRELTPDIICVVAYGKILPKEILDIPKHGCINVHPSLLPKYRGATPIQTAIMNGDKYTGVTTMYMDEWLDSGDIILQDTIKIKNNQTMGDIWNILSEKGAKLLVETLKQIDLGTAPRIKQGNNYTVTEILDKSISRIDWENQTAEQIHNLVRGLNPIMGAYTTLKEKKIKFWNVEPLTIEQFIEKFDAPKTYKLLIDKSISLGTIIRIDKEHIYVKANDGILQINEIQGENSKKMNTADFLRGARIQISDRFE